MDSLWNRFFTQLCHLFRLVYPIASSRRLFLENFLVFITNARTNPKDIEVIYASNAPTRKVTPENSCTPNATPTTSMKSLAVPTTQTTPPSSLTTTVNGSVTYRGLNSRFTAEDDLIHIREGTACKAYMETYGEVCEQFPKAAANINLNPVYSMKANENTFKTKQHPRHLV